MLIARAARLRRPAAPVCFDTIIIAEDEGALLPPAFNLPSLIASSRRESLPVQPDRVFCCTGAKKISVKTICRNGTKTMQQDLLLHRHNTNQLDPLLHWHISHVAVSSSAPAQKTCARCPLIEAPAAGSHTLFVYFHVLHILVNRLADCTLTRNQLAEDALDLLPDPGVVQIDAEHRLT